MHHVHAKPRVRHDSRSCVCVDATNAMARTSCYASWRSCTAAPQCTVPANQTIQLEHSSHVQNADPQEKAQTTAQRSMCPSHIPVHALQPEATRGPLRGLSRSDCGHRQVNGRRGQRWEQNLQNTPDITLMLQLLLLLRALRHSAWWREGCGGGVGSRDSGFVGSTCSCKACLQWLYANTQNWMRDRAAGSYLRNCVTAHT